MDAVTFAYCLLSCKSLPPTDCEVDEERIDLDRQASTRARLRRDQGRAASKKRLVDCLAGARIVKHRPAHAFHRLLGCVPCLGTVRVSDTGGQILHIHRSTLRSRDSVERPQYRDDGRLLAKCAGCTRGGWRLGRSVDRARIASEAAKIQPYLSSAHPSEPIVWAFGGDSPLHGRLGLG